MDLVGILGSALFVHILTYPISFLLTQGTFNGQRQWYLISLVACIPFGMLGFLVVWIVYRLNRRSAREAESNFSNSRIPE